MNDRHEEEILNLRKEIYENYGRDFQDAELFDIKMAERWGKGYIWYLRNWLPDKKDASIADLGCGCGKLLYLLKELGYDNLNGVDISNDQIVLARKICQNVEQADVLNWLSHKSCEFDLLVALDLLEHLTRLEALDFISMCFSRLKKGGRLILQTPNADSPFGMGNRYGDLTHEFAYSINLLSRILRRAGFTVIEARELGPMPFGYSFRSTLRYFAWMTIRKGLQLINLAETGSRMKILTRVFIISGIKNI